MQIINCFSIFLNMLFLFLYKFLIHIKQMRKEVNQNYSEFNLILTQSQYLIKSGSDFNDKRNQLQSQIQTLILKKGSSFWNLDQNFQTIYNNFNLLSYFSPVCRVRILDRLKMILMDNQGKAYQALLDIFNVNDQDNMIIIQRERTAINFNEKSQPMIQKINNQPSRIQINDQNPLRIVYQVFSQDGINIQQKSINYSRKLGQVAVEFTTKIPIIQSRDNSQKQRVKMFHVRNHQVVQEDFREYIHIKIRDINGWIKKTFGGFDTSSHHRINDDRRPKIKQIQYFYIEPESQRYKFFEEEHVSLAFQGGGCKGVQYIGAQRAVLQQLPDLKVKTVIGSSIGALIGVSVCCGLTPEEISQLIIIDKLSNSAEDKKYKKLTLQQRRKMNRYFLQIVKWLEQYRILEDQLIIKLRLYLEDPIEDILLENILVQFFRGTIDPVIRQLFIDTEEQVANETIIKKSESLNQSTRHLNNSNSMQGLKIYRLNLFGLLNAALMTGQVNSVSTTICVAKCLHNLWKKKKQEGYLNQNKKMTFEEQKREEVMQKYRQVSFVEDSSKVDATTFQKLSKVTMKQLYYLTGIQFTCTAVDMNNQILRFFNQKTTPDLPVAKAVQMSASFPVAFEAQHWKQQWGKYYIHYDNIRRQIDLTGVKFTDGGTLSNLPIKYLDNEYMRPMYFSHIKTSKTKIYGIGFLSDYRKPQTQDNTSSTKFKAQFGALLAQRIGKWVPLKSWFKTMSCGKGINYQISIKDQPFKAFTDIPLIKFLLELLYTLYKTRDNLNEECFSHSTYQTIIDKNYRDQLINRYGPEHKKKKTFQVYQSLMKLYQKNMLNGDAIYQSYVSNLLQLQRGDIYFNKNKYNANQPLSCLQDLNLNEENIFEMGSYIQQHLLTLIKQIMSYCQNQDQKQQVLQLLNTSIRSQESLRMAGIFNLKDLMSRIDLINNQKIFILSQIQQDLEFIANVSKMILRFCENMKQNSRFNTILRNTLYNIHKVEQGQLKMSYQSLSKNIINHTQISNLQNLQKLGLTTPFWLLREAMQVVKQSKVPQLFINLNAQNQSIIIKSYVLSMINKYTRDKQKLKYQKDKKETNKQIDELSLMYDVIQNYRQVKKKSSITKLLKQQNQNQPRILKAGVHILLQAVPMAQMYFHTYYRQIKAAIYQYNQASKSKLQNFRNKQSNHQQVILEPLKVTTMTSTGYHSLIMFLHASDLPGFRIEEEVWNFRDLIQFDTKAILQQYNNGSWAKIDSVLLRQMQNKSIQKKKDIFKYIEQYLIQNDQGHQQKQFQQLKQKVNEQIKSIKVSNQEMGDAINNSLNFVVKELMQIQKKNLNKKQAVEALAQKLTLNTSNSSVSQVKGGEAGLKRLSQYFGYKFGDIFKYILYRSSFVSEHITNLLRPEQRKQAWRVSLMAGVISGVRIKDYVIKILAQMNLGPDTTLKQFYQMTSKKIQLNFCVVQQEFFTIYNHYTRPNMPLWAVILATSSIPEFFSPVIDRPQWKHKSKSNYKQRQVQAHFAGKSRPYKLIHSSEILSSFPLDLLKNNVFRDTVTQNKDEIFLSFNFSQVSVYKQKYMQKFQVSPITIGDLINKFVKITPNVRKKYSQQEENLKAMSLVGRLNAVNTKLNILNLFVESHDNLILRLYKKQVILNPIRFQTLQFSRVYATIQDPQNPGKTKYTTSDLCEDTIMQNCYILTQKIRNRKAIEDKEEKNSLMEGSRILFMRAESIMDSKTKIIDKQKIRLRFLSMLNPQRSLYQRFAIYYQEIRQNSKSQIYTRLYKEEFQVSTPQLIIKIQYVSNQEITIKTGHFVLDFSQLFKLSQKCRFGFIYPFFFDKIYGFERKKQFLTAQDYWKIDYMNKKSNITQPARIGINSIIKNSYYQTILCYRCSSILKVVSDRQGNSVFRCPCDPNNPEYSTILKYDLRFDAVTKKFKCPLNHGLVFIKSHDQNQFLGEYLKRKESFQEVFKKYYFCKFCNRRFDEIWRDEQCDLQFCEKCRTVHMDIVQN